MTREPRLVAIRQLYDSYLKEPEPDWAQPLLAKLEGVARLSSSGGERGNCNNR